MASGLCSSLGLLLIVCLQSPPGLSAFPQISVTSLLNNALIRAQYIHQAVADTYRDYERTFMREDKRYSNKNSYAMFCYSETIAAPTDKDDAHQKSDMDLLRFSLTLIQSWMTPVQSLNKPFTNQVFGNAVYEKLRDLEEGLYALMRELDDGNASNYGLLTFTYDKFDSYPDSNDDARIKNYGLLYCFKKDMHKVETYLKMMKCRRSKESNCMF